MPDKFSFEGRRASLLQIADPCLDIVGHCGVWNGTRTKLIMRCSEHGDYQSDTIKNLVATGRVTCQLCNRETHNAKQAYIHLVAGGRSLKFGIALDAAHRIKDQNKRNKLKCDPYGVWVFPDRDSCRAAEREILSRLECATETKEDMQDGYTETTRINNLDAVVSIYRSYGGIRQ